MAWPLYTLGKRPRYPLDKRQIPKIDPKAVLDDMEN
jgi:hypothetical protein